MDHAAWYSILLCKCLVLLYINDKTVSSGGILPLSCFSSECLVGCRFHTQLSVGQVTSTERDMGLFTVFLCILSGKFLWLKFHYCGDKECLLSSTSNTSGQQRMNYGNEIKTSLKCQIIVSFDNRLLCKGQSPLPYMGSEWLCYYFHTHISKYVWKSWRYRLECSHKACILLLTRVSSYGLSGIVSGIWVCLGWSFLVNLHVYGSIY
jgi:hypothetical protein